MANQAVFLVFLVLYSASGESSIEINHRHDVPPEDKQALFQFPLLSSSSSQLLSSSTSDTTICAPELDGYFGGGTGDSPIAQLHVVQAARERILETILPTTFPDVCDGDKTVSLVRPLDGKITGYHFGKTGGWQ